MRMIAVRFYVELARALRRSYEGWRGNARALYAHAAGALLQRVARFDLFAPAAGREHLPEPQMHTSRLAAVAMVVATVAPLSACTDRAAEPLAPSASRSANAEGFEGMGAFQRYVSIGTSISMGVNGDGVYAATQQTSFPAQLARLANRAMSLPLISAPGCAAPIAAPLAGNVRLSGEPIALPFEQRQCAPNEPGVTLPTQNVSIDGARTSAALFATPENPDPGHAMQYPRVLPPGMSQITAMEAQKPKMVSVELGGNEILGARYGVYPDASQVVPVAEWAPLYRQVTARVAAVTKEAVLVGLVNDVRSFPSFRTGAEIYAARATFAPLNVVVSTDCQNSTNLLFVAVRVPAAAAAGAYYYANQLGPYTFSCQNAPSFTGIQDYVLDANDVAGINAQLAAMNQVIRDEATKYGFAYFPLGALYEDVVTKPPFNALAIMTTAQPYGPYVSLDGIHPTAEGSRVLADAAAKALNDTYRLGIPTSGGSSLALFARQ
jgi:lysophospholipase L1-like esterase